MKLSAILFELVAFNILFCKTSKNNGSWICASSLSLIEAATKHLAGNLRSKIQTQVLGIRCSNLFQEVKEDSPNPSRALICGGYVYN